MGWRNGRPVWLTERELFVLHTYVVGVTAPWIPPEDAAELRSAMEKVRAAFNGAEDSHEGSRLRHGDEGA